jgi:hypothetical protein
MMKELPHVSELPLPKTLPSDTEFAFELMRVVHDCDHEKPGCDYNIHVEMMTLGGFSIAENAPGKNPRRSAAAGPQNAPRPLVG